ncbi:phage tail tape measure protein [Streptomyces collinus]|uniref:phage tail tape measure protein n=1 Tax=Streptomyces collinus TaxID=42684 RepID=UPI00367FEE40
MANIELGTAYINVLPSTNQLAQGIRDAFRQATQQAQTAGNQMGNNLASGINSGLNGVGQNIRQQLNAGATAATNAGNQAGSNFTNQFRSGIAGVGDRFRSLFNGSVNQAQGAGSSAGQRFHAAFSRGLDRTREAMGTAMKAGAVAAGAAFAGGLVEAASQEASADRLAASMGLTGDEQKKFGSIAGSLYAKGFGESTGDNQLTVQAVLSGIPEMRNESSKAVSDIATQVATISDLTDEESQSVVNSAKQLVTSGLAGSYKEALDVITKGNQLGLNSSQDLLDTFNEYSPYLGKLGLDAKTSLGIMKQGLAGGARNLDVVGDAWKEFGIRAIDGSATSVQAYKDLGLNADKMAAAIAKGGPSAAKATSTILEKIKAIKDPVKQNNVAVGLFGTMWEDNSKALLNTDFSKAASEVGKVSGATAKAGKTLHDNAKGNIEMFYRALKQKFVDYIGNEVLPVVAKLGDFIKTHATAFKILAGVLGGVVAAAYAYRAAMWAVKIAQDAMALARFISNLSLAAARQKIITAATKAWAFAQRLLNAAMRMNPIGLVITALLALGAIFTVLYKKNETFRNLVNTVWAAIKTAIVDTWTKYIQPALMAFWGFIKNTLWPIIQQLWTNVISPIFGLIKTFFGVWWAGVKIYFEAWKYIIVNVLWPVLQGLWTFVSAVFSGIWSAIKLYWGFVKGVFNAWKWVIMNVVWPVLQYLWTGVKVVFSGIWATIKGAWALIKGVFNAIKWVINNVVAPAFRWLRDSVIKPVWSGIVSTISGVWNNKIKPIFNALKNFISNTVAPAFKKGIDKIGSIWNSLKAMAAKPINFLIEWVYNKGIRKMINLIPGVKDLAAASPIKFARGGAVNGGIKGKDSVNAMLMPGEHVWTTKEVNAMGGQAAMYRLRESVRKGKFSLGEAQHYAKGGAVKNPDERVYWDGEPISRITAAQLSLAQSLSGSRIRVMQGSWQPRTSYSGTSHAGPGVVDTSPGSFNQQYYLRRVGFAAWARNIPGAHTAGSGAHVHSVSRLDPGARGQGQLAAFNSGGDGLGGRDYGPRPALLPGLLDRLAEFGDLSVYGGKGGDNSSWLSLFGKIKGVISSVRKWASGFSKFGAWGDIGLDAAKNIGNNVVQWINDKIPNRFLPDNPIPSIFDTGGVLEPGMLAYNASSRPEAVFNHSQFKSFAENAGNANAAQFPSTLTLEVEGYKFNAYVRGLASDEVSSAERFNNTRRRMG